MKRIVENRASAILYNFILSNNLEGKKFLIPANICPIVPTTLLKCKVKYEFIDISLNNYLIDKNAVKNKLRKENIAAIIFVRTYGYLSDENDFFKEMKSISPETLIIDDRCLSIPNVEEKENSEVDLILYSTGYSKYIDFGYGAYAFIKKTLNYNLINTDFDKKDLDELVEKFKKNLETKTKFNYIDNNWLNNTKVFFNEKEYFLKIKKELKKVREHKKKLNNIYKSNLPEKIQFHDNYNNWRFNILANNKDTILNNIFKNNLFASSHYQPLVNMWGQGKSDNSEQLFSKVINLFNDFRFTEEKALKICEIINKSIK